MRPATSLHKVYEKINARDPRLVTTLGLHSVKVGFSIYFTTKKFVMSFDVMRKCSSSDLDVENIPKIY